MRKTMVITGALMFGLLLPASGCYRSAPSSSGPGAASPPATIRTDRGRFDTVTIDPVLRRNGNLEDKGNLRIWMTRDERHVPVRLYARFRKVRTWTLVGELVPGREGG